MIFIPAAFSALLIVGAAVPAHAVKPGMSCPSIAAGSAEVLANRINSALDPMWPGMEAGDLDSVTIANHLLIGTRVLLRDIAQLIQTSQSGLEVPEKDRSTADELEKTLESIYELSKYPEKKVLLGKTNLQKIQALIPSLKDLLIEAELLMAEANARSSRVLAIVKKYHDKVETIENEMNFSMGVRQQLMSAQKMNADRETFVRTSREVTHRLLGIEADLATQKLLLETAFLSLEKTAQEMQDFEAMIRRLTQIALPRLIQRLPQIAKWLGLRTETFAQACFEGGLCRGQPVITESGTEYIVIEHSESEKGTVVVRENSGNEFSVSKKRDLLAITTPGFSVAGRKVGDRCFFARAPAVIMGFFPDGTAVLKNSRGSFFKAPTQEIFNLFGSSGLNYVGNTTSVKASGQDSRTGEVMYLGQRQISAYNPDTREFLVDQQHIINADSPAFK